MNLVIRNCLASFLAMVTLTCSLVGVAEARQTQRPKGVPHTIRHVEPAADVAVRVAEPKEYAAPGEQLEVSFRSFGRAFILELEPTPLFTPGAKNLWVTDGAIREEAAAIALYKGRVQGEPDSWARISIRDGDLDGMIWTPDEIYFVQPQSRLTGDQTAGGSVAYRLSETDSEWLPGSCAAGESTRAPTHSPPAPDDYAALSAGLAALLSGSFQQAELGIVADYEYYLQHGANAAADMQSIINQVDGIYRAEVGASLQITATAVFTTPSDPFSGTTDPYTLLTEFGSYKSSPSSAVYATDIAHLFTDRNLDGNVIGIAWLSSLCAGYYSTGLSQDFTTDNKSLVLLTAHEIGHNFGAPHDNQAGSPCAYEPFGFIMNPYLTNALSLQFSGCSHTYIGNELASVSCLTTVSGTTPTPAATATRTPTRTPTPTRPPTNTPTLTPTIAPPPVADIVWVEDALPAGASVQPGSDPLTWVNSAPGPVSGTLALRSRLASGLHQQYFAGATATLPVNTGDKLIAYVYLDPSNPPGTICLQWFDGTWEHRAYWGANTIPWGTDGTASRRSRGPLPPLGRWVRLSVGAGKVGLSGRTITGMAFTLVNGQATWDHAGKYPKPATPAPTATP